MTRKRDNSYLSRHVFSSVPKRHRPMPSESESSIDEEANKPTKQSSVMVVVTGLPHGCSVLKLKSRFEMYGPISRLRIDRSIGYITFRSKDSAEASIAAALDPFLGITIDQQKVLVSWANDPLPQWREGVGISSNKDQPSSKLLRAEVPLSRRGRGNKLGTSTKSPRSGLDLPFKGREIIAYDDLL